MWERCHWRFLYLINAEDSDSNKEALHNLIQQNTTNPDAATALFTAMNKEGHIYKFATQCGSWDWKGIGIMLVCCNFVINLDLIDSILRFLHSLVDCRLDHESFQEVSQERELSCFFAIYVIYYYCILVYCYHYNKTNTFMRKEI